MLMKLTACVIFINIILTPFLCKSALCSFSLITVWLGNFVFEVLLAQKLPVKC
jgi:hypothetical protein